MSKASTANYKTRMLVRRPAARTAFSGVVIAEWLNVTSHVDIDLDFGFLSTISAQGELQFEDFLELFGVIPLVNSTPQHLSMNAALHSLVIWVAEGTSPASAPSIDSATLDMLYPDKSIYIDAVKRSS